MVLLVVSDPAINMSMQVAISCSSENDSSATSIAFPPAGIGSEQLTVIRGKQNVQIDIHQVPGMIRDMRLSVSVQFCTQKVPHQLVRLHVAFVAGELRR